MKRNINKLISSCSILVIIAGVLACNKDLNVTDQNNPTVESYFKTAAELQNGVNAIYSSLRVARWFAREVGSFTHDMRGGECATGGAQLEAPRAELLTASKPDPGNSVMSDVWGGCYTMINRANVLLSKAPDVTDNVRTPRQAGW